MASLRQKPDGRFYIDYRDAGERRRVMVQVQGQPVRDPEAAAAYFEVWKQAQAQQPRTPKERPQSPRINAVLDYYRDTYLAANNAAEATHAAAQTHCAAFLEWCRTQNIGRTQQLNTEVLTRWSADLQRTRGPRTAANYLNTIRSAFNVAVDASILAQAPVRKWIKPKFDPIEKHPLTLEELRAVIDAYRDMPIVVWMCLTGQRPSDARTLQFGDVDLPTRTVHRPSVKVRALRKFEISQEAADLIATQAKRPHTPADTVFLTAAGRPWSADGLLNQIKAKARRTPNVRPITPKMLRDSFGTIMANDIGLPLPELQILMGHTDIKTTMQYIRARGARTWLDTLDTKITGTTPTPGAQTGAQNMGATPRKSPQSRKTKPVESS